MYVMSKKRTFEKKITVQNFKAVKTDTLLKSDYLTGKGIKELAKIVVEIFFTPRGYLVDVELVSPVIVWDFEQACKIKGITESNPDGELADQSFASELAAMHFITRRLSKLGWEPNGVWEE
jgi:hypothetical protein